MLALKVGRLFFVNSGIMSHLTPSEKMMGKQSRHMAKGPEATLSQAIGSILFAFAVPLGSWGKFLRQSRPMRSQ